MQIILTKNLNPISDFKIEDFYQSNKNKEKVFISNAVVLDRFRLGYLEGDFSELIIKTFNNEEFKLNEYAALPEEICNIIDMHYYNIYENILALVTKKREEKFKNVIE